MRHWRDQDEEDRPTCQQNRYLSLVPIVADLSVFSAFCRTRICRDPVQCTYIAVFESDPLGYGVFCLSLIQRDLVYFAVLGSCVFCRTRILRDPVYFAVLGSNGIRCILRIRIHCDPAFFTVLGSFGIQCILTSDPSGSSGFCPTRIRLNPMYFAVLGSYCR